MGNVIEFALGLQSSEFLSKLGVAGGEVLSFAGLADLVGKAWDKTWSVFEQGKGLEALHNATGESVGRLAQFQHGLEAVGGSSENLGMMLLMADKSLSGLSETGQNTGKLFASIGLDMRKLRGEDTVDAITEISTALGKLNPAQAAAVAESLFGRGNAEQFLQISNDAGAFKDSMQKAALTASLWEKFSKVFQEVKNDVEDIENDMLGIWIQVGGKLAPELHKLFSETDYFVRGIVGAIEQGKIGDILSLSLIVGIEYAGSFLANYFGSADLWAGVWDVMKGEFLIEFAAVENAFVQCAVTMKSLFDWVSESFGSKMGGEIAHILDIAAKGISVINPLMAGAMRAAAVEIRSNAGNTADLTVLMNENEGTVNKALGSAAPGAIYEACKRGQKDPRQFFPSLDVVVKAFEEEVTAHNSKVIFSRQYGQWEPDSFFHSSVTKSPLRTFSPEMSWIFSPFCAERKINGMLVRVSVPMFENFSVPFEFSAPWMPLHRGKLVRVHFNPREPKCRSKVILLEDSGTARAGDILGDADLISETAGHIRLIMSWAQDDQRAGYLARQRTANALRRVTRGVGVGGRIMYASDEERDGLGTVTKIERGIKSEDSPKKPVSISSEDVADALSTRVGKIARLPRFVRDELNRRLDDGSPNKPILDWINELPETRSVVAELFDGQPVNKFNIYQWRKGGYRDWLRLREKPPRQPSLSEQIAAEIATTPRAAREAREARAIELEQFAREHQTLI